MLGRLDSDEFTAVYEGWQVSVERQGMPEDIDIDWDGEDEAPSDYWFEPEDGMAYYIRVGEPGTLLGSR